ncbi:MAG: hypothetical protein P4M05_17570 [Bradyrhizobium sp.]|nr:hypothetical protein [Bradyrhizobium sp.]
MSNTKKDPIDTYVLSIGVSKGLSIRPRSHGFKPFWLSLKRSIFGAPQSGWVLLSRR